MNMNNIAMIGSTSAHCSHAALDSILLVPIVEVQMKSTAIGTFNAMLT
jgi:hypothetical protein